MALPTIRFQLIPAATNSSLHSAVYPALCALLDLAGWTQLYIDSDAIGGGSSGSPAWDKTPAASTQCGRAVYQQPANGHTRQWALELVPAWAGDNTELMWRFRVGTGVDGGNNLQNPGDYLSVVTDGPGALNAEVLLSVSEDGFAMVSANVSASISKVFIAERARDVDGTVLEDLWCYGFNAETGNSGTQWPDSTTGMSGGNGRNVTYRAGDAFQYTSRVAGLITGDSLTGLDGEHNIPAGPIPNVPQVMGYPRHALFSLQTDATIASDHPVYVDGALRTYRTNTVNPSGFSGVSFLAAKD